MIPGRFDHLVPQTLYEKVKIKIKKFSAHPLEQDSASVYTDDGKDYYEVELSPDDGPYLLPYMARRSDGTKMARPLKPSTCGIHRWGLAGGNSSIPMLREFLTISIGRFLEGTQMVRLMFWTG